MIGIAICLILCVVGGITANNTHVKFFGFEMTADGFEAAKSEILCMSRYGDWQRRVSPPYQFSKACSTSFFEGGVCRKASSFAGNLYEWQSDASLCHHPAKPYSFEALCRFINGRHIMVVGDSLNEEFVFALMESAENPSLFCDDRLYNDARLIQCPNGLPAFNLSYYRNDRLTTDLLKYSDHDTIYNAEHHILNNDCFFSRDENFMDCNWINFVKPTNVSLLFLNKGAHYDADEFFLPGLEKTLSLLQRDFPEVSIIYRDTPYGHNVESGPDPNMIPLVVPLPPYNRFNYPLFEHQNQLAQELIRSKFPQVVYVDFFTSTILRPDSHRDFLHYCLPGPPLMWVQSLFFNTLQILHEHSQQYHHSIHLATHQHCGQGWQHDYHQLHHQLHGSAEKRNLLFMVTTNNIHQQLFGVTSALYSAIISGRSLLMHSMSNVSVSIEDGLDFSRIQLHRDYDTLHNISTQFEIAMNGTVPINRFIHLSAIDATAPLLDKPIEELVNKPWTNYSHLPNIIPSQYSHNSFYASLLSSAQNIVLTGSVPFAHKLLNTSVFNHSSFSAMGMDHYFSYSCGFHFLFHPKPTVVRLIEAFEKSDRVKQRWQDEAVIKIGFDLISLNPWATLESMVSTMTVCAQELESVLSAKNVVWYIMSDNNEVRLKLSQQHSDKVVYFDQLHSNGLSTMADIILLSQCNYILSHDNGSLYENAALWISRSIGDRFNPSAGPQLSKNCQHLIKFDAPV